MCHSLNTYGYRSGGYVEDMMECKPPTALTGVNLQRWLLLHTEEKIAGQGGPTEAIKPKNISYGGESR